jgi:hypothetical protein
LITEAQIKARLLAVIDRREQSADRSKMAKWGVLVVVEEVVRIVKEAVDAERKSKEAKS